MPRTRNYKAGKRSNRKPRNTKKVYKRRGYKKMVAYRSPWKNPIPQKGFYKFKFQDSNYELTTTAIGLYQSMITFRGNSLFDPDYTGVGVQPYGYDNLCAFGAPFGAYKVYASKIKVIPHPTAEHSANFYANRLAVFPTRNSTVTYTEWEDVCQLPWCKKRVIENINDYKNIITNYVQTNKILPDAGKSLDGETYAAYYNTNPADPWYWQVLLDTNIIPDTATIKCDVIITYYAMLYKTDDVDNS